MSSARPETAVLVTRPEPGATALIKLLDQRRGLIPFRAPLFVTEEKALPDLPAADFDLILLTSPRALGAAAAFKTLPLAVVGEATAGKARAQGFHVRITGPGQAGEDLAATIPPGTRLLHLSGVHVSRDLAPTFANRGIAYRRVPVYDAIEVRELPKLATAFFEYDGTKIVTFLSARAAEAYIRLAAGVSGTQPVEAVCISERVAEAARTSGLFTETLSANTANLEAFVDFVSSRRT